MDEYFGAMNVTNAKVLCVGGITRKEAEAARGDGLDIDGTGYYIFLADQSAPKAPVQILGQLFSPLHAAALSRLLGQQTD